MVASSTDNKCCSARVSIQSIVIRVENLPFHYLGEAVNFAVTGKIQITSNRSFNADRLFR